MHSGAGEPTSTELAGEEQSSEESSEEEEVEVEGEGASSGSTDCSEAAARSC